MIQLITVSVTTDASGDYSATIQPAGARLLQYRYVPDGTTPLATDADLDVVGATTGLIFVDQDNIGTAAFTKAPRQATHDVTGAASLYAETGEPVEDYVWVGGEPLTVTVSNGGSAASGTFYFWFG